MFLFIFASGLILELFTKVVAEKFCARGNIARILLSSLFERIANTGKLRSNSAGAAFQASECWVIADNGTPEYIHCLENGALF